MKPSYLVAGLIFAVIAVSVALIAVAPGDGRHSPTSSSEGAVALIYIDGAIQGGRGSMALGGSTSADVICELLHQTGLNPRVKAVVIRLNSPGGSAAGSSEVASAIRQLRNDGMPVVASMADVAASGAYWIAAAADEIVADPATITGSIGVIMEIHNIQELYRKLGIESETIKTGEYKDIGSSTRPITDSERQLLQAMLEDVHDQFVRSVADYRGMPVEQVLALADGRVFTGRQALEYGLVDTLGGLQTALERAAARAGLARYEVVDMTRASLWSRWLGMWSNTSNAIGWDQLRRLLFIPWSGDGKWRFSP